MEQQERQNGELERQDEERLDENTAAAGEDTTDGEEADKEKTPDKSQNLVAQLYDKIPLTFQQVDLLVKVLIGAFVLFLIFIVWQGLR